MRLTTNRWRLRRTSRWLLPTLLLISLLAVPASASFLQERNLPAVAAGQPAYQTQEELTWELVHDAPGVYWYTIDCPTDDVCYVAGGPDWNVNNGRGTATIAKSTDGGNSWSLRPVDNTNFFMRGLTCKDENTCWLAGASSPRIRRTVDGGQTWLNGIDNYGYQSWFWSAGYTGNGNTVIIGPTGYFEDEPGRLANFMRSTDGINFTNVIVDGAGLVQWDFSCPAPGVCYSASKERAYYTNTDGATWTRRYMSGFQGIRYYGISCSDINSCWIVGANRSIAFTRDTGVSWGAANVEYVPGARPRFWNVEMLDGQNGYAVGCTDATDGEEACVGEGMLYRTTDGVNWVRVEAPTTADLMDLHVFNMEELIVVDWEGKIWRSALEPTPTPTPTNTATPTSTPTATATPTSTPSPTPSPTATPSVGVVQGKAFQDLDGDLLYTEGEPGLPGARVVLRQGSVERYGVSTDSNGEFLFSDVEPGQYTLLESEPPQGAILSRSLFTFQVEANRSWTIYIPHRTPAYYAPLILSD